MQKWTKERVWDWYNKEPWIRGCNFMGSDCANRIDQWQEEGFEQRLIVADRELKLAADTGLNAIRILPEYAVYREDPAGFYQRFERYLDTAAKYGIRAMLTLGNDCLLSYDDPNSHLKPGPQHYDWGYHGGRKRSQHSSLNAEPGWCFLDDPEERDKVYQWVGDMITRYRTDERVVVWDLYNEPGNAHREEISIPHVKKYFEIAREVNPMQPITSAVHSMNGDPNQKLPEVQRFILEESDIVSYHNYGSYMENIRILRLLKRHGRPIMNTEWLARMQHNTVEEMFPLFYLEKIGCFNWGLVAGLYQTYEPWEAIWENYERGRCRDIDFKVWFHDLYRPNLRPYDPHEIELMRELCSMADEDYRQINRK